MKLLFKWNKDDHLRVILAEINFARLWQEHERTLTEAYYQHTGLRFQQKQITVRMNKNEYSPNYSGSRYEPMQFNLEYQDLSDMHRLCVLSHELGHRLLEGNGLSAWLQYKDEDKFMLEGHKRLYLFLYDVWVTAFGKAEADKMAKEEAALKDPNHQAAWKWAMGKNYKQRQTELHKLVANRKTDV